jgi:hypothetical protein
MINQMYFIPFIAVIIILFFSKNNIIAITSGIISTIFLNVYLYKRSSLTLQCYEIFDSHLYAILHPTGYLYPLLFLVGVGILIDLFEDLDILSSYTLAIQKLFYGKKKILLYISVIASSVLFSLDDYLVIFGIKNFFNSIFSSDDNSNKKSKYTLPIYSSLLGGSASTLFLSTWTGVIVSQITKLVSPISTLGTPVNIFFSSRKFFFFPLITYCFLLVKSFFQHDAFSQVASKQNILQKKIIKTDIFLFLIFPLCIFIAFVYNLYWLQASIDSLDVALILCQGLLCAFTIISILLFLLKSIPFKFIVKRAFKTMIYYIEPVGRMILCWIFSRIMIDIVTTQSSLMSTLGHITPNLLPILYYLFTLILSTILGSEWTTIALVIPLIPIQGLLEQTYIMIILGAVISGAISGCQISPVSNTNMTTAAIYNVNSISFYKEKIKYIFPIIFINTVLFFLYPFLFI